MAELRTASVKVNLTPDVFHWLRQLAERQGQAPSVLAAVAVGQYVAAHSAPLRAQETMIEEIAKVIERMPQQLLDLDREERRSTLPVAPLSSVVPAKVRRRR